MSPAVNPVAATVSAPSLAAVFVAAMRSEWTKLRTVRSTLWALLLTTVSIVGLGTLFTALKVAAWENRSPDEIFDPVLYSLSGINLAQFSVGVLGVLIMSSEYATGAIRLSFAATPQRRLLLAAKVATFAIVVAVIGVVSCFAAFVICQGMLSAKDADVSLGDPGVFRGVLGGAGYLVLLGAIAIGVGAALRHTAGAVAVLFAVLLVLPGLVLLLPAPYDEEVGKYLPGGAGQAMSAVGDFPGLLSPGGGFVVLCAYTAATLIGAAVILRRRDA